MIGEGRVALNGTVIDTPATVLPSLAGVTVDGNPVAAAAPARLFLYHKPNGLLVTERDPGGRPTIYDRLPRGLPRLMPVGRLDRNTEGLLLLTTDGELKRQLELPSTGVERAYRARAYGQVTQAQLEELIEGVTIDGVRYGSINANLERRTGANVWIEIIITEGKNREVRRVLEHLGLRVSRLIRTRYGPFVLGDLPNGGIGEVRQADLAAFRRDPKRPPAAEPTRFKEARGSKRTESTARPTAAPGKPRPPARTAGAGTPVLRTPGTLRATDARREGLSSRARRTLGDPRRRRREDEGDGDTAPRVNRTARRAAAPPRRDDVTGDRPKHSRAPRADDNGERASRRNEAASEHRDRPPRRADDARPARPERANRSPARDTRDTTGSDRPRGARPPRTGPGNAPGTRPGRGRPGGGKPRTPRNRG